MKSPSTQHWMYWQLFVYLRRADWLRISFTNDPNEPITKSLHNQNLNRKPGDIFSDFEHKSHDKMMELLKREDWKEKLLPKELH